uniref:RNA helicase n=1 Tax=Salix viminalis TaxID=40686 RepID=A0A6N2M870_SALVM
MSVSERVAAERGEKLGESVGYKVRLEGMRGRDTRLLFCTTGILLRRLLLDRDLKGVTHVIVDEIHERGMNEDFLLIVLRDLLPRRPELRLILMSATLNADLFSSYFGGAPAIHIPLQAHPILGDPRRVLLLACHGSMASSEQRLIFDKPEDGVRKIVLATNMLRTSITINDVVFVVDCGKAKETSYDAINNTPCLLPSWISKAAARQVQNAVDYLKVIGALDEHENLTVLGATICFSVEKFILDLISILSELFKIVMLAESAKAQFSARDCSDHIALVRAYNGWKDAERQQSGHEYCWKNFLSAQTLKAIDSLRKQFFSLLKDTGLVDKPSENCNSRSIDEHLMRAVICADPKLDIQFHNELLMAIRLLVSEDQCEGRFVFGRHLPASSKKAEKAKNVAGDGGGNSKNELQTLLARAGHEAPTYKTKQLKNNQFRSTVFFNGLDFVGQPCSSKKLAEKDAAAAALLWLKGETHSYSRNTDSSVLLKKSKTINQNRIPVRDGKWN